MTTATLPEAAAETRRVCMTCMVARPLDQFRRRETGTEKRHRKCASCFAAVQAERRERQLKRELFDGLGEAHRRRDRPSFAESIFHRLVRRCGGMDAFVARIVAMADDPNVSDVRRFRLLQGFLDIGYLVGLTELQRSRVERDSSLSPGA